MTTPQKIQTCIWFDKEAEEAARFYTSLFENSGMGVLSRYGAGGRMPEGLALMVTFHIEGVWFQALNGGPIFKPNEAMSLSVSCDTQEEIDRLWRALTAHGGEESQCGWLKDRWGVSWQIVPSRLAALMTSEDKAANARVMEALMGMRKIDSSVLEAAARGA